MSETTLRRRRHAIVVEHHDRRPDHGAGHNRHNHNDVHHHRDDTTTDNEFTFDAGSDTGHATEILDILAANGVRATFGMTGRWADANPALVRRMVAGRPPVG